MFQNKYTDLELSARYVSTGLYDRILLFILHSKLAFLLTNANSTKQPNRIARMHVSKSFDGHIDPETHTHMSTFSRQSLLWDDH